jgi:hypothetical protein
MKTSSQVLAENPNLLTYRITLKEECGDKFSIIFDCYAENDNHAEEQAENAYPNCDILTITPFSF